MKEPMAKKMSYNRGRPPLKRPQTRITLVCPSASLAASLRKMVLLEREIDFLKQLVKVSLIFSKTVSKTVLICLLEDTSAGVSAAKLSNETDFVSRLLKDQQA